MREGREGGIPVGSLGIVLREREDKIKKEKIHEVLDLLLSFSNYGYLFFLCLLEKKFRALIYDS